MAVLLGIDIGTTHCKAAAYSESGRILGLAREETPLSVPRPGWAEHPAEALWETVVRLLQSVIHQLGNRSIPVAGIGVAGMAEAGLLISKRGEPLTPIVAWHDTRCEDYTNWWQERSQDMELPNITGISPSTKVSVAKCQWLRDHEAKLFHRAWKWLHAPDYIAYRLCHEVGTDYSLAGRTMAFDIRHARWSEAITKAAGLPLSLWPTARPSTSVLGVTSNHQKELGLLPGIPVVVAGHDHICGAAGMGILAAGKVLDSLGTAESLLVALDALPPFIDGTDGYSYGCHTAPGKYYVLGGLSACGATIEWWLDRLLGDDSTSQVERGFRYKWMLAKIGNSKKGPTGVLHVPYLRGSGPPDKAPQGSGALLGISDDLDVGAWMKAVIEGLACESRRILDGMPGNNQGPITAIGGGTKNPIWMQVKAEVCRRSILIPWVEEAVAQGAALLAGVGAGVYSSLAEACASTTYEMHRVDPDPLLARAYNRWYNRIYLPARDSVTAISRDMKALGLGEFIP